MLTRTAGVELAPHNILVVGVGPGAVATPINLVDDGRIRPRWRNSTPPYRWDEWPSRRRSRSVVALLAGGGASYITATTVFADGGLMQSSPGL